VASLQIRMSSSELLDRKDNHNAPSHLARGLFRGFEKRSNLALDGAPICYNGFAARPPQNHHTNAAPTLLYPIARRSMMDCAD
jgi:hypothetical protein